MQFFLKDLSIDTEERSVRRGDQALKLPDLSFDVLVKLIEAAPAPVSVVELSESVWRTTHVSDDTIAQRIALLRKALGDNPKAPVYVRTIRGAGYCLAGKVTDDEHAPKQTPTPTAFTYPRAVAAAAALGCMIVASWMFFGGPAPQPYTTSPAAAAAADAETTLLVRRARQQLSLHQAQETDRAISMLREALTRAPTLFDARLTLSFALSTKATKFRGDTLEKTEAETIARALINERPDSSGAWSALGYTLSSQGRPDEALAAYRQAFRLDPQNASALSSAAHLLQLKGDLHQALILEMKARNVGGASRYAEIQIAQVLELIEHPAANDWRAQAIALNPEQAVILAEVAKSHLRRGEPQAALDLLAQYEGSDASAPHILVLRGRALIALDRTEEARRVLEMSGWRGRYGLAAISALAGDPTLAANFFPPDKRVDLASDPDPDLRVQLAEVFAALGEEEDALELMSQAVSLGWRDIRWLQQSPFLSTLISTNTGRQITSRIAQELEAQRQLIEATEELKPILSG